MTSPQPPHTKATQNGSTTDADEVAAPAVPAPAVDAIEKKPAVPFLSPQLSSYFIAGGLAGAASRTVVSPLERLKIIQQVQPQSSDRQYKGVWSSLIRMWREEGFRGFMRGNGINCLRIVPYSAVQFTTYEQLKRWLTNNGVKKLDTRMRLTAGALAGITSVCATYPLDLVRSRLSIATATIQAVQPPPSSSHASPALASAYHTSSTTVPRPAATLFKSADLTMWGMTLRVMRDEGGVRALYRGLVPTAMGVAPYVGINFAAYESLRGVITPPEKTTVPRKLLCGALAGSISQTLTYPFDVLRRKMQVTGMGSLGYHYNGALDALQSIVRTEGLRGLYRGLWPNLRRWRRETPGVQVSLIPPPCVISESGAKHCDVFLHIRIGERVPWGDMTVTPSGSDNQQFSCPTTIASSTHVTYHICITHTHLMGDDLDSWFLRALGSSRTCDVAILVHPNCACRRFVDHWIPYTQSLIAWSHGWDLG